VTSAIPEQKIAPPFSPTTPEPIPSAPTAPNLGAVLQVMNTDSVLIVAVADDGTFAKSDLDAGNTRFR
jgi:hypothetical protein